MDIDAEQLLHSPPQKETGPFRSYTVKKKKTCLHQSSSYLATDEDERRCDDLPVFDKCVFHLVGERSAEGKKSARGSRGGEERGSEGRCEANAVRGKQREDVERHREKKLTELCHAEDGVKENKQEKNKKSETQRAADLTLEDCVLSEPYRGEYGFCLMCLLWQEIKQFTEAAVSYLPLSENHIINSNIVHFLLLNSKPQPELLYSMNHGTSAGVHQLSVVLL